MTFALVPAAGKSTRMGEPKLFLPLGGQTVVEHLVGALRHAGIHDIVMVAAPALGAKLKDLMDRSVQLPRPHVLTLTCETPDMRATVEHGLDYAEAHFQPRPEDDWLLIPADHPSLSPAVMTRLCAARREVPARSICVPTFEGRRGHPTLIAWKHVAGMRALPAGVGINSYLRLHAAETREVQVASEEVLQDLDTPEDYRRLLLRWDTR